MLETPRTGTCYKRTYKRQVNDALGNSIFFFFLSVVSVNDVVNYLILSATVCTRNTIDI